MTATIDANILIYASNDGDPLHPEAREFLSRVTRGPELLYVFWPAIFAYLRIVTHHAILPKPMHFSEARDNISNLLRLSHIRAPGEDSRFWRVFLAMSAVPLRGNDLPDAHIVALMHLHGVATIYTRDRDFRKYSSIKVVDPFGGHA